MIRRLLRFCVAFSFASAAFFIPTQVLAAGYSWTSHPSAGTNLWNSMTSSANGQKLAAVEQSSSNVWTSSDAGTTWTSHSSGANSFEYITSSSDGTRLVAMEGTNPGDLWISTDSGVSWTDVPAAGARTWVKAVMSSDGKYIYGTDTSNTVITSSDYGVNWTTHTVTGAGQLRAITTSADGKYLVVSDSAGGGGNIWYSTNFGVNWTDTGVHALNWNAFAMTSSADGKYVTTATYNNGDVWTSSDFGATWTQRTASIDQLDGLAASSSGKYLAAAGNGGGTSYVWTSSDYGVTWTQQSGAGQGNWRSIVISADGSRIATVDYGPGFIWTGFDPSLVPGLPNTGNGTPINTWPILLAEITLFAVGTLVLGHKYLNR